MNSNTEWPAATIRYRLNLPCALHSISPALSALHTFRAAALHPETSAILYPTHCPKCGTYRFSGEHPTNLVGSSTKKKRKRATSPRTKALQRKCHLCGFLTDPHAGSSFVGFSVPVQLPSDSSTTETGEIVQESPTVLTTKCPPVPPLPGRRPQSKSSHAKLKNMLSCDRQREDNNKKGKNGSEGLAAFLKEL